MCLKAEIKEIIKSKIKLGSIVWYEEIQKCYGEWSIVVFIF